MPGQSPKEHVMSHRGTSMISRDQLALPRGWVILGLGAAAWFSVIGMASLVGAVFHAIASTVG